MMVHITTADAEAANAIAPDVPHPLMSVGWFVALSLGLAGFGAVLTASVPSLVPFLLALGPAMIAFAIAWSEGDGALGRLVRLLWRWPEPRTWYLLIALPVAWAMATVVVGVAIGRSNGELFTDLMPSALIVPLVVLIPAFAEEIAWRGFATPRLMTAISPLQAALVLAAPWVVMHLVLMLPGGINAGLAVWATVVSLIAYAVVLTWAFVGSGGSVLLVALLHAGFNGVVPLMRGIDGDTSWAIRAILAAVIAFGIVTLAGYRGAAASADRTVRS